MSMDSFKNRRTRAFYSAVSALRKLPLKDRSSAFAEASADDMRLSAYRHLGNPTRGAVEWCRVIGRKSRDDYGFVQMPGDDHTSLLVKKGALTYVSQPYGLDLETMGQIVDICRIHGMRAVVHAGSWYFPSGTICVEYTKAAGPTADQARAAIARRV
jgi:hypothetical protein